MIRHSVLVLILLSGPVSAAIEPDTVSNTGAARIGAGFLALDAGARPAAMGGAYTAVADDATSVWWNPSGLARLNALSAMATYNTIGEGISLSHIAGAMPAWGGVVGASIAAYTWGSYEVRDQYGTKLKDESPMDVGGVLGYGFANPSWLGGRGWSGLSAEFVSLGAGGTAIGGNAGVIMPLARELSAGLALRNLGTAGKGASLPAKVTGGAEYYLPVWRVRAALDAGYGLVDQVASIAGGVEIALHPVLAVRVGYRRLLTDQALNGLSGITGGVGFRLGAVGLDYAFQPMGDLVTSHRFALYYAGRKKPVAQPVLDAGMKKPKSAFDPAEEYQAATRLSAAGDHAAAATRAGNALAADPKMWQAWQVLGNAQYAQGDKEGALVSYKRALEINPGNTQLAGFVSQLESQKKAVTPAPAAPGDLEYQESVTLYGAGNYPGALEKAGAAIRANSGHWQAWQMVGNCRYAMGDKTGAIEAYRYSLKLNPSNDQLKGFLRELTGEK